MESGTIKFYNNDRGYGFITDQSGKEYFFHVSGLINKNQLPKGGESVTYDLQESKKGLNAVDIKLNESNSNGR